MAADELRIRIVCTGPSRKRHKRRVLQSLSAPRRPGRPDLALMLDHDHQAARNAELVTTFTGSTIEDLVCPVCQHRQQWTFETLQKANVALGDAPGVVEWDVSTGRIARLA